MGQIRAAAEIVLEPAADIGGVLLHLHPDGAGEGFRQNKSDEGGGDGNQQKDCKDYGLADAYDPPVIQEM